MALPFLDPLSVMAAGYMNIALNSCPGQPPPKAEVVFHNTPYSLDRSKNVTELNRMRDKNAWVSSNVDLKEFNITGGLTRSHNAVNYNIEYNISADARNTFNCVWMTKIIVTVDHTAEVFINQSYKEKSCRYTDTLAHELRHVAAYDGAVREFVANFKKAIDKKRRAFPVLGPLPPRDQKDAQNWLQKDLNDFVEEKMLDLATLNQQRNAGIDTAVEYSRASNACPYEPLQ